MSIDQFNLFNPTEVHSLIRASIADLVRDHIEPQASEHDERETFNRDLFRRIADTGFLGVTIPDNYGGAGADPVASVIIIEEISKSDPGFGISYLAHDILFSNNLFVNGSEEQKQRYLPRVNRGELLAGLAMTEPGCGTDVLAMKTTAEKKGNVWVLNGTKQFITNYDGDVFLVYARTGTEKKDLSLFIVEKGYKGFSVGKKEKKLGMRASSTGPLIFEQCEVPEENLVGRVNGAAYHMMRNLEIERVALAAQSVGIALRCLDEMVNYARTRESFGVPLIEIGQVKDMIAQSYAETFAARALLYDVARKIDPSSRNSLGADSVKLFAAQVGKNVADRAIQILGGYGYSREYVPERLFRDAKLIEIGGGTNQAMQNNIARQLAKEGLKEY